MPGNGVSGCFRLFGYFTGPVLRGQLGRRGGNGGGEWGLLCDGYGGHVSESMGVCLKLGIPSMWVLSF